LVAIQIGGRALVQTTLIYPQKRGCAQLSSGALLDACRFPTNN
jgi:hypothetical protein